ncbi:hypothetical protein CAAN1_14S03092 [[Candida] anglica]|uniref:Protein SCD5 n=1 Tax=[Candida] anglica TaxID=148631 RepID=A0ABP0EIK0_9ASCO
MNGSGFDWLQASSTNNSGSVSPAPMVSFGGNDGDNNGNTTGIYNTSTPSLQVSNNGGGGGHDSQGVLFPPDRNHLAVSSSNGSYTNNNGLSSSPHHQSMLDISIASPVTNPNNPIASNPNLVRPHANSLQIPGTSRSSSVSDSSSRPTLHTQESSIPLSLQTHELTFQESKTYMRWYSDILARTNARTISMSDVYSFLSNFKISEASKEKINKIFVKNLRSINIGEFFALLRLISHTLNGQEPSRTLIKIQAPTPSPPSILSKKRHTEDDGEDDSPEADTVVPDTNNIMNNIGNNDPQKPLDLDSFTQFMLTGERPEETQQKKRRSKKSKSVKFSDQIVTDIHDADSLTNSVSSPSPQPPQQDIDYSLPMDQLLGKIRQSQAVQPRDVEEEEILKSMETQINHFQNLNTVDMTTSEDYNRQLLRPNMTGPAQMSQMFSPSPEPQEEVGYLQPNMTGPAQMAKLQPNVTGPADMARLFQPNASNENGNPTISLQSFSNQLTGNTLSNTVQNSRSFSQGSQNNDNYNRPMAPPPVPQNRRSRSSSSPTPRVSSPLSSIYTQPQPQQPMFEAPVPPPVPPRNVSSPQNGRSQPPPPPPSRRRTASTANSTISPPPLPPKVSIHESPYEQPPIYTNDNGNDSTSNLLTDLKALQDEVDKIRNMTGGF